MTIPVFAQTVTAATFRDRVYARLAVLLARRLERAKPSDVERTLQRWANRFPPAEERMVAVYRNAVCAASRRCRGQEGCLLRSLSVVVMGRMRRESVSWCTGIDDKPFRAHAWVEVNGKPVGEPAEVETYAKTMEVPSVRHDGTETTGSGRR
jgi:ATP-binding cassette subfamily B protein